MLMTDWAAPGTSMKYRPARSFDQTGGSGRAGAGRSSHREASVASGAVQEGRVRVQPPDRVQHPLARELEAGAVEARLQQDLLDQGHGLVVVAGHHAPRDAESGRSRGHAHGGAQQVDRLLQLLGGAVRRALEHRLGEQVGDPGLARLIEEQPAAEAEFELDHGGLAVLDPEDGQAARQRLAPHLRGAHARRGAVRGLDGAVEGAGRGALFTPRHCEFGLEPPARSARSRPRQAPSPPAPAPPRRAARSCWRRTTGP